MNIYRLLLILLIVTLLGSNAFSIYALVDSSVSNAYLEDSYKMERAAADQCIAILPYTMKTNFSKDEILEAAQTSSRTPSSDIFEKDGYTLVGDLGLKFSEEGRITNAKKGWD